VVGIVTTPAGTVHYCGGPAGRDIAANLISTSFVAGSR